MKEQEVLVEQKHNLVVKKINFKLFEGRKRTDSFFYKTMNAPRTLCPSLNFLPFILLNEADLTKKNKWYGTQKFLNFGK